MATIAKLIAHVGLKTKEFEDGIERVQKSLDDVKKRGEKLQSVGAAMTKGITAPVMAAAGALAYASVKAAGYADQVDKMSIRTGIAADRLQVLRYQGDQLGVTWETNQTAIGLLTRKLPDLLAGGNDTANTFKALGVAVRDSSGNVRSMSDMYPEVIKGLSKIENETQRNAMAFQLFGRQAQELIPMIAAGADELERLEARAHQLGLVMAKEDVAALVAFQDQLGEFGQVLQSVRDQIALAFLPITRAVVAVAQEATLRFRMLVDWFRQLSPAASGVAMSIAAIAGVLAMAAAAAGPLIFGIGTAIKLAPIFTAGLVAVKGALAGVAATITGPVLLAIGAAVLAVVAFKKNWFGFGDAVRWVWDMVASVVMGTLRFILRVVKGAVNLVIGHFVGVVNVVRLAMSDIRKAFGPTFDWIKDKAAAVFGTIARIIGVFGGKAKEMAAALREALAPDDAVADVAEESGNRYAAAYLSGFKDYIGDFGDFLGELWQNRATKPPEENGGGGGGNDLIIGENEDLLALLIEGHKMRVLTGREMEAMNVLAGAAAKKAADHTVKLKERTHLQGQVNTLAEMAAAAADEEWNTLLEGLRLDGLRADAKMRLAEIEGQIATALADETKSQKEINALLAKRKALKDIRDKDKKQTFGGKVKEMLSSRAADAAGVPGGVQAFAAFGAMAGLLTVINRAMERLGPTLEALIEPILGIVDIVADALKPILQGLGALLMPLIQVISILAKAFAPLIKSIIMPLFRQMWPIIKWVSIGLTYLGQIVLTLGAFFKDVMAAIANALGGLLIGLGNLINKLPGSPGNGIKRAGEAMQNFAKDQKDAASEMREQSRELGAAREDIRNMSFDDALESTARAADKLSGALTNVPNGVKIALARFEAATGVAAPGASMTTAPGTSAAAKAAAASSVVNDNSFSIETVQIIAEDHAKGAGLLERVRKEARDAARRADAQATV
jgi:hypothetical protein